jgi:hypothetical protein
LNGNTDDFTRPVHPDPSAFQVQFSAIRHKRLFFTDFLAYSASIATRKRNSHGRMNMDALNTWLIFNVIGSIAVIAFGLISSRQFAQALTRVNLAGASGAMAGLAVVSLVAKMFV